MPATLCTLQTRCVSGT